MTENHFRQPSDTPTFGNGFDKPSPVAPLVEWRLIGDNEHLVQFYERDATLVESMWQFFTPCFTSTQAAIVIATKEHREALEDRLKLNGFDVAALMATGQYMPFDPAETLAKFRINGIPDSTLFKEVIGSVIGQAIRNSGRVRIFGEMVALLLEEGDEQGALALEQMWNDLARTYCFTLFCAYPLHRFAHELKRRSFTHICGEHSRVIPVVPAQQ